MISLYTLDGTELQFKSGSVCTISWVSTAFNDSGDFSGSFSYPVSLAYSPSNNRALGMANRLENRSARQDVLVNVRIFGIHWKQVTLRFTIDLDSYSGFLLIDNGAFAQVLTTYNLNEIFINFDSNKTFVSFQNTQITGSAAATATYLEQSLADNTGAFPAYFFPVHNKNLFGSFQDSGGDPLYNDDYQVVNPWTFGQGVVGSSGNIGVLQPYAFYTPFFSLHYVVRQVLNYLGYSAAGDFFTDPMWMDKVIYNTGFFDINQMFAAGGLTVQLAKHLPQIALADFFKMLRTTVNLAIYFDADSATCTMNIVRNILQTRERTDISGCVNPNISIKAPAPLGFELVQPVDSSDANYAVYTYDRSLYIGSQVGPTAVDNYIGTPFMANVPNLSSLPDTYLWRVPFVQQTGNAYTPLANGSDAYNNPDNIPCYNANSFSFRLLTYRGMQNAPNGQPYPYASSDDLNSAGVSDYGMSLQLTTDPKSIVNVYNFAYYNFFLRSELVELDVFLPMRLLQQITPLGVLQFRTPSQAIIPAMLNDMTFEASQNEARLEAKMRVYPIYCEKDIDQPATSNYVVSQVINPGSIFVKFTLVYDDAHSIYTYSKGKRVYTYIAVIATLNFYSDAAGTVPRNITGTGLAVLMNWQTIRVVGVGPQVYQKYSGDEVPDGSVYTCPDITEVVQNNVATQWFITTDPALIAGQPIPYTVIGDANGGYTGAPS
jgi:hypothetical protein